MPARLYITLVLGLAALLRGYAWGHPELDLEYVESDQGLFYRRRAELDGLRRLWRQAHSVAAGDGFAERLLDFAERLCSAAGFALVEQAPRWVGSGHFCALTLDVGSTFSDIPVPNSIPFLFFPGVEITDAHLADLRCALEQTRTHPRDVAILALFAEGEGLAEARQLAQRLRQVYALEAIVFSLDDLLELLRWRDPRHALRKRILAEVSLLHVSPFVTDGATPDHMFFGREVELAEIQQHVDTDSFALFGGRKVGKTSILQRLGRVRLCPPAFRPFSYNCQRLGVPKLSKADFLAAVAREWVPDTPTILSSFAELLGRLPAGGHRVFLIDEADVLVSADRNAEWPLFGELRALAQAGRCQFVFAGEQVLREAILDSSSPLFNFANPKRIAFLDERAVRELVCRPLQQLEVVLIEAEALVRRVYDATGGHPNVVQRLCQRLIEHLNKGTTRQVGLTDVDAILADPQFQQDYLSVFWERATPLERILTLILLPAAEPQSLRQVRGGLRVRLGLTPPAGEVNAALNRLAELRSVLVQRPAGYVFAVPAFKEVLAHSVTVEDLLVVLVEEYQHRRYASEEPR